MTRSLPMSMAAQTVDESARDAADRDVDELDTGADGRVVKAAVPEYRPPE